jgi:hypothetical protein
MSQLNEYFRITTQGLAHWCPGCGELHVVPVPQHNSGKGPVWTFNGNYTAPTFYPSVRHTGKLKKLVDGRWTGEWVKTPSGRLLDSCCHYFVTDGKLLFCTDCTHEFAGKVIPLPPLPPDLCDPAT